MAGRFVDISAFQPEPIDWNAYKAWSAQDDSISRVAMRSSYGLLIDQSFEAHRANALAAGIDEIIFYHYCYPQLNNPVDEAAWQRQVVGNIRPQDLLALDIEEDVVQATPDWVYSWLFRQAMGYGKLPRLYSYLAYIQQHLQDPRLAKYPLWLASWTYSPDTRPPVPTPWTSYEAVQYTDQAVNIPGISGTVDADIFLGGSMPLQPYGPNSSDFNNWFTVDASGNWVARSTNAVIIGGNKGLFSELSIDGNTLPVIGLPRTNELYQQKGGVSFSVQFFERGTMVYDPQHVCDSQPGMGDCYLGKYDQFKQYDPAYQPPTGIPANVQADIKQIEADEQKLVQDAGL